MDKSLQNDIKDNFLPKRPSDNTISAMSSSSSDLNERGEKVCSSENTVNKVVSASESSHESAGQVIGSGSSAGNCLSNLEVSFSGDCQQPKHNIHLLTPHQPSLGSVQQETSIDVSQIESNVVTQKSDCQTDLEVCDDSTMLKASGPCHHAMLQEVESIGCDLNLSPDKVIKEFVPCAVPKDVVQVQESVVFVESVNFVDGREKFSENSDGSQQSYLGSCYSNSSTQIISFGDDQTCTSSVSSKRDIVDQESSIPNEVKDSATNFPIEQCNIKGKSVSDLHLVVEDASCNNDLLQELAVCVVDKILDEAAKSVLELKNVDVKESNLQHENSVNEVSDNIGQGFRKSLSEITDRVSENTVMVSESSDLNCRTNCMSSFGDIPYDVLIESKNDNMFEPSPYVNHDFQIITDDTKESLAPVVCNGTIVSLKQSNCTNDLMPMHSLSGFDVSVIDDCDCQVDNCVIEGYEAKVNSSNDCLNLCENVDVKYSSNNDKMTESLGQKTEVVKAASYVDKSNLNSGNLICVSNQDLEAKVECSNDLSLSKSLTVLTSSSLKDDSLCVVCEREIDISCEATSDLSVVDFKDKSKDLSLNDQDIGLKEQEYLKDLTTPLVLDQNVGDKDCVSSNVETVSEDINAVHDLKANCIHGTVCSEVSVAKDQDITEENVCEENTSLQENLDETKSYLVQEDLITDGENSARENEKLTSEKRKTIVEEVSQCNLVTPISEENECTSEKPETVGDKGTAYSRMETPVTRKNESATKKLEIVNEKYLNAGMLPPTTDKNECIVENEKIVVEAAPANPSSEENVPPECTSEKPEAIVEVSKESEFVAEKPEATVEEETSVEKEGGTAETEEVVFKKVPANSNTAENECTHEKTETVVKRETPVTKENEFTPEIREKNVAEETSVKGKEGSAEEEETIVEEEARVEEKESTAEKEESVVEETSVKEKESTAEKEESVVEEETSVKEKESTAEKEESVVEEETSVKEKESTAEKEESLVEEETSAEEKVGSTGKEEAIIKERTSVEEKDDTAKKEESIVKEETCEPIMATGNFEENNSTTEKLETATEELIASDDTFNAVVSQVEIGRCQELMSEEPIEVNLKEDLSASCPLLGNAEENSTDLNSEVSEIPQVKQELPATNSDGENAQSPLPLQFIVPIVNVCPPIIEETYDGITDDESEISHATSDSESDSNVKMAKPICDGINTINYKPLLEEDSNDRSTLSLISELDEASVKEDNVDNEQWEDESVSLILVDDVDRHDNTDPNSEVVQRVKGQRIKMATSTEGNSSVEEEPNEQEDERSLKYAEKIKDIKEALESSDSLERLRELARCAGGLVNDQIRKEAWPRLLGIDTATANLPLPPINMEELPAHKSYTQVVLDVNRSLRRFPTRFSATERADLQNQLTEIILRVLMIREDLSYYQGYHDVAVTTLLVAGKDTGFRILERISVTYLADCMQPTFARTSYLLNYIYPLIKRINPSLAERMDRVEVGTMFCLPWFLTWYGYSLNHYEDIVRLFDYFLASPPLAPIYLAAVVVGQRSAEVLAADPDQATVHALLSRIPETLVFEDLLQEATDLYRNYPPDDIDKEVKERYERLRKEEEEGEEQRKQILQRRSLQRRHSMFTIGARQMPGWYYLDRFLGFRLIQRNRILHVSATVLAGFLAWHLRNEMYRYF